jgi:pimeloyl-ACP methyl ester carboxylesterase
MIDVSRALTMAASKTFVLVHGAWHGGWCWSRVASILRGRGHIVLTPTQTGVGERSHLLSRSIDLDVSVADIVNVLQWEDLKDVVLIGHSFGGHATSGTADRVPERISQLVYLDAWILENGQTPFSQLSKAAVQACTKAAKESSDGLSLPVPPATAFGITDASQAAWVESGMTPQPFATYTSPLKLKNQVGNGLPTSYIVCANPIYEPAEPSRNWARAHGWTMSEIAAGHAAMVMAPGVLADLLEAEVV